VQMTRLVALTALLVLLGAASASSYVFTGSLTSANGGIVATPSWETVSLGWTVTQLVNQTWRYNYDLFVSQGATQQKNISHMLVEASLGFTECDILTTNWVSCTPKATDIEVQQWTDQQGNPSIPGPLYGIKFNTVTPLPGSSTGTHWLVQFDTTRAPVWGDFYAKDGKTSGTDITAWNAGFLLVDPTDGPANGSISNKLLRPDSTETLPSVPEFSAPMLASLAGLIPLLGAALRRRK
jgi:hypothetical protein